jgi:hypothetical protein
MITRILADEFRLLSFRRPSEAMQRQWKGYLMFGLAFTWLAGVGRYWDNPRAELWQHWGLGSVAYVFLLALLIWALLAPLRPRHWSYRNVLLFITLTAPPAVLYAIPVEQFLSPSVAREVNAWFLGVVAAWRVGLFAMFLRRVAGLSWVAVVVATLLPLTVIVFALVALNLEHVVFELMSGIREEDRSPNDDAYFVVFLLAAASIWAAPILAVVYLILVANTRNAARSSPPGDTA